MAPRIPMFRLRTLLSLTTSIYIISLISTSVAIRTTLVRLFSPTAHPYRFVSLLVALALNHKSLPFAWHFRLFGNMFKQLYFQPTPLPEDALFRPLVTSHMYTPLMECDYNLHKSNSTYFADLDIGRSALVSCLLRKGIRAAGLSGSGDRDLRLQPGTDTPPPVKGNFMIALGGVSCQFKKEVKPYEPFEIWTRVLSWDHKWIYLVSHVVKAGAVKPDGWALQPWKEKKSRTTEQHINGGLSGLNAEKQKQWKDAIFATSISKYVTKKGRLTIHPEIVLNRSDLLPIKPTDGNEGLKAGDEAVWNWANVEEERARGMKAAQNFAALDGLIEEFPNSGFPYQSKGVDILGAFSDSLV